jgi:hypothetical protein
VGSVREFGLFQSLSPVPVSIKILHTLFLVVLIPVYWIEHGPANFLWFSDIALFVTAVALWREDRLLASMQAVSVGLLEIVWNVDFFAHLLFGMEIIGLSSYMFDETIPLFVRGLSSFHVWLPPLLFWLVWRLGYDKRAWLYQSILAWMVLTICYVTTDPKENINWVFGPGEMPQHQITPGLYFTLVMVVFPLGVYWPTHLILKRIRPIGAIRARPHF